MVYSIKRWLPLILGVGIAGIIMLAKGIYAAKSPILVMTILSDSFFSAGVIVLGVGLLSIFFSGGAVDMLSYSVLLLLVNLRFRERKYNSFADYRSRERKRFSRKNLIISGLILLSISLIFLIVYLSL